MPNNTVNYHPYSHRDTSVDTVGNFVSDISSIGNGYNIKVLLSYEDINGVKNIDAVFELYTDDELVQFDLIKTKFNSNTATEDELNSLPLKIGTNLSLELIKIDREVRVTESNQVINTHDFASFLAAQLKNLLNDKSYIRTYVSENKKVNIKDQFPFISIWVWSRTLSLDKENNFKDVILNVTPFVSNLTTSNTANGGNFSFDLSPCEAEFVGEQWKIREGTIRMANNYQVSDFNKNTVDKSGETKRSLIFFNTILQQNDVVFIRFEKLELENNRDKKDFNFQISATDVPGKIFDMIGLIDNVPVNSQHTNNDTTKTVNGRDLIKLFIEDGIYFYPTQFTDGGLFANTNSISNSKLLRYDGQLQSRFQVANRTIDRSLKFLINALGTIKITSDSLWDAYGERRSMNYQVTDENLSNKSQQIENEQSKVKQIKDLIEKSVRKDKLDESTINIDVVYKILYDFINYMYLNKKNKILQIQTEDVQGDLTGWIDFTYIAEELPKSIITKQLDEQLYKRDRVWQDEQGRPITEAEGKVLIADLEKQANQFLKDKQRLLSTNNLLDELTREDASKRVDKNKKLSVNKNNEYSSFTAEMLAEQNAKFAVPVSTSTTPTGLNKTEEARKIRIEILEAQYNDYKKRVGKINSSPTKKHYDNLNEFAKQAFIETYRLIKLKNKKDIAEVQTLEPLQGIWQIVKLIIDPSIANRRIVDSSIGNEHGSLLNGIRKICQEPFCEFFTDTYGDQFYLTVRKKPFDKESIISMLEGRVVVEKITPQFTSPLIKPKGTEVNDLKGTSSFTDDFNLQFSTNKTKTGSNLNALQTFENQEANIKQSLIIEIDDSDIQSENLVYSQEAYSWYKLFPQNLIGGNGDNDMALAYLKAVYFEEYADIYGSKPLDITTNYLPYFPIVDKNQKLPVAYFIKQGMIDLKYMIDSHCYLPFTRQGTIIVNGDRRIKRGTFIKLKSTDEVFYVDGVSNQYSIQGKIDRTTTLQISRGMIEKYIKGVTEKGFNYSYFNIINTEINESAFTNSDFGYEDFNKIVTSNWRVNKEVFNFFLKRYQWLDISKVRDILSTNPKSKVSQLDPKKQGDNFITNPTT